MREIQYQAKKLGGRSGHVFKDLFTSVILARLLDAKPVYSPYWKDQKLIPQTNVKQFLNQPDSGLQLRTFKCPGSKWNGIGWNQFQKFSDYFLSLPDPCRVRISSVYRIHLYQIKNWEDHGKIDAGMYARLIEDLRALYWGNEDPAKASVGVRRIVIHARRGDVANRRSFFYNTMGPGRWPAKFYQKTIDGFREQYPQATIRLLTEKQRSKDLDKIKGAEIDKGDDAKLSAHFREMVTADLFVPTNSSLSTWAAYLTRGLVATSSTHEIKHFGFDNPPTNHIKL